MKIKPAAILIILLIVILTGCNRDVFIDRFLEGDISVTVDNDGARIDFLSGNWNILESSGYTQFKYTATFPDGSQDEQYNTMAAKGHVSIKAESPLMTFTVERNDDKSLEIIQSRNISDSPVDFSIIVGNEWQRREIKITFLPGDKFIVEKIEYDFKSMKYSDVMARVGSGFSIHNSGSTPVTSLIYPYRDQFKTAEFNVLSIYPDTGAKLDKLIARDTKVEIPDITGGKTEMKGTQALLADSEKQNLAPDVDPETAVEVVTPPMEKWDYTPVVGLYWYSLPYKTFLIHKASGERMTVTGMLYYESPYNFHIMKKKTEE